MEAIYGLYVPGQNDYGSLVTKLQRAAIDVLYVGGYGRDAGLILKTAREEGNDVELIGGDGLGMDEFWSVVPAATAFITRVSLVCVPMFSMSFSFA